MDLKKKVDFATSSWLCHGHIVLIRRLIVDSMPLAICENTGPEVVLQRPDPLVSFYREFWLLLRRVCVTLGTTEC